MKRAVRRLVDDLRASLDELVQTRAEALVARAFKQAATLPRRKPRKAPRRRRRAPGDGMRLAPETLTAMHTKLSAAFDEAVRRPYMAPWDSELSKAEGGAACVDLASAPAAVIPVREMGATPSSGDSSASPGTVAPPAEDPPAATPEPPSQPHALPGPETPPLTAHICTENPVPVQHESRLARDDVGPRASERASLRASMRTRPRTLRYTYRLTREERREGAALDYDPTAERPLTRGECIDAPRPCPFVSCRYHLFLDVSARGAIKIANPAVAVEDMRESCALDLADRGGLILEQVGEAINLTRERVRQVEERALYELRTRVSGLSAYKDEAA